MQRPRAPQRDGNALQFYLGPHGGQPGQVDVHGPRAEAKAAGVTAFCPKPMFLSDLRDSLMTAIGQKPEEQQGVLPKGTHRLCGQARPACRG